MKKLVFLLLLLCMFTALLSGCGSSSKTLTLNVYNWGEYISDGSEDSLDTVKAFESWYEETYKQKVKVNIILIKLLVMKLIKNQRFHYF